MQEDLLKEEIINTNLNTSVNTENISKGENNHIESYSINSNIPDISKMVFIS